jgi:nitrate reductase NapE component
MIELLLLYNLSSLRDELREPSDTRAEIILFIAVAQIFIWPITLFALIKRIGVRTVVALSTVTAFTATTLVFDWTFYFLAGFAAFVISTAFLAHLMLQE